MQSPNNNSTGKTKKTFGTFQGVFTPTVLTILGVIMYLRQPWVVGNAGVLGALAIILLAIAITLFTALSMSSITTNIRIGSGGAFSIISQSLGLEIGGSIGIPLYFSQACAVAMYVFGLREGWVVIFPSHDPFLVDMLTFILVWGIVMISTDFAFKIQYVIMAIVFGSIISIVLGLMENNVGFENIQWLGNYKGEYNADTNRFTPASFWIVFAIFFPAVTGIMAGANMSGDLTNPRENIPKGTLSGVLLTGVVYVGLIFVAALLATEDELTKNYMVFVDKSIWPPIVLAGLLGATFSSALSSFVGAPRILYALGEFSILPGSKHFIKTSRTGEPRNAMYFTALVVLLSLLLRDLNAIAPLITMFFMITYAMINVVVLIEQSLGLPSFRPTFKVPIIVPLLGTLGCFFVMFIINPTISLVAIISIVGFYGLLLRRELDSEGDSRSGLFTALAEWATKKSNELSPEKEVRAWQPELLMPIESSQEVRGTYRLIYALTYPKGSVKVLGMDTGKDQNLKEALPSLVQTFKEAKITASHTIVDGNNFGHTVSVSMQALGSAFFKPNIIFIQVLKNPAKEEDYRKIINASKENKWGLVMFLPYLEVGLGIEKVLNVWIDEIPENWETKLDLGNSDLALLLSFIIRRNWNAKLNIIKTLRDDEPSDEAVREQLERIKGLGRFPKDASIHLIRRDPQMWAKVPQADLNIIELPNFGTIDFNILRTIPERLQTSCMFTIDSGRESVLV